LGFSEFSLSLFEVIPQFLVLILEVGISSVSLGDAVLLAQTLDSGVFPVLKDLVAFSGQDEAHAE